MQADLEFFGSDASILPDWMREKDKNEFIVYACNVPAFKLFRKVQTQWRSSGFGKIGLDYSVVFQILDREGVEHEKQLVLLDQLQLIEFGYLEEQNSK